MDGRSFDAITRSISNGTSRRNALRLLGGALAGGAGALAIGRADAARRCRRWALSGGPEADDLIVVDDQIYVYVNGEKIYGRRGDRAGQYPPILFRANRGDRLRIIAKDVEEAFYELGPLHLHCVRGRAESRRLTRGVARTGPNARAKGEFFNEVYTI
ncbi:MAG: hypothetical protein M3354_04755 [Chloroflexota bacterium]|nr:hypothetical protein [Chloroflexota bacterium]